MAYFITKRMHRTKRLSQIVISILLIVAVLGSGITVYAKYNDDKRNEISANSAAKMQTDTHIVLFKANRDIPIGTEADMRDFDRYEAAGELVSSDTAIAVESIKDKRFARDIKKNEILKLTDLVEADFFFKPDDRLIEQAFAADGIPSDCKNGSIIDIRLFRPEGNDPVVISKVFVMKRVECNLTMYMDMMEQELLKQSIKEGALYILLYGNPTQEASRVDYSPNYRMELENIQ